mmetsp:Transcript_16576/g.27271  ORF Transcript_16576/g.27271 Transcript_16576/m.27271 type:complete len:387 (+) Transcript_16576:87-1247(+)
MSSSSNINPIISFVTGLVTRLAATIPSSTNSDSTISTLLSQLLTDLRTPQSLQDLFLLTTIVVIALEILNQLVYHVPTILSNNNDPLKKKRAIPVRGKHLDNFSVKDYTFIMINKCMTGLFVYCYFGYLWSVREPQSADVTTTRSRGGGHGIFTTNNLSLQNTLLPLPLLFLTYDFFYTLLHWFLHIKSIYVYVHKHHHFQKAPSRANIDAVNVHPLEFFLGEFNHILALMLVVRGVPMMSSGYRGMDVSWVGAVLFIGVGGVLAGLNHTRHDVVLSVPSGVSSSTAASSETEDESTSSSSSSSSNNNNTISNNRKKKSKGYLTIFDSKHHDVHHRIPQSNYGQYTVFWDRIFGTFRDYDENDRVNPAYQLDPLTGKTVVVNKKSD